MITEFNQPFTFINIKVLVEQCDAKATECSVLFEHFLDVVKQGLISFRVKAINFVNICETLMFFGDGNGFHIVVFCRLKMNV